MSVLLASPFDRTINLDVDVLVCGPLEPAFSMLDHFEVGFVREPTPSPTMDRSSSRHHKPGCLGTGPWQGCVERIEANNGFVMVRRDAAAAKRLLIEWQREHTKRGRNSQNSFPFALVRSQARYILLPPEWNARLNGATIPQVFLGPVVVSHTRLGSCSSVNRLSMPRLMTASKQRGILTMPLSALVASWDTPHGGCRNTSSAALARRFGEDMVDTIRQACASPLYMHKHEDMAAVRRKPQISDTQGWRLFGKRYEPLQSGHAP